MAANRRRAQVKQAQVPQQPLTVFIGDQAQITDDAAKFRQVHANIWKPSYEQVRLIIDKNSRQFATGCKKHLLCVYLAHRKAV